MPILPIRSPNLPGPSSADFSFFPDEDENQEVSSNQELSLKDRMKLVIDRWGYQIYSSLNPPLIMPLELAEADYQKRKKEFFAEKPKSYEEARARVLSYTEDNIGTWGPDLEIKNVELYADPEFRKTKAKEYADRVEAATPQDEQFWLVMSFCKEELHALYKKEPKYLRSATEGFIWMLKGHNKPILARHRREWDQLSPSEKAEKIFDKGKKFAVVPGIFTAAACFFLCHGIYQQLQSPHSHSTF